MNAEERTASIAAAESQHGPIVVIGHPDGSEFGFMVLTREMFDVREARAARGDADADEFMLQERCVWPSREQWNKYVAASVFETMAYIRAYKNAHGGSDVRPCDKDELPESADTSLTWLINKEAQRFGFKRPGRADVKMFQAKVNARARGEKGPEPLEQLLRSVGSADFGKWLDSNPFGIGEFGGSLVGQFGMTEARVSPK